MQGVDLWAQNTTCVANIRNSLQDVFWKQRELLVAVMTVKLQFTHLESISSFEPFSWISRYNCEMIPVEEVEDRDDWFSDFRRGRCGSCEGWVSFLFDTSDSRHFYKWKKKQRYFQLHIHRKNIVIPLTCELYLFAPCRNFSKFCQIW